MHGITCGRLRRAEVSATAGTHGKRTKPELSRRYPRACVAGGSAVARQRVEYECTKDYVEQRNGGYFIAGTRISLDSIVYGFQRGESPETICQNFELLSLEEVYGAITFYLANQASIDEYLVRQDLKWGEEKRQAAPIPAELRLRLERARPESHASRAS